MFKGNIDSKLRTKNTSMVGQLDMFVFFSKVRDVQPCCTHQMAVFGGWGFLVSIG